MRFILRNKLKIIVITSLLLIGLLGVGCNPTPDFHSHLSSIVKPYTFSIAKWEFGTIIDGIKQLIFSEDGEIEDGSSSVAQYFSLTEQIKTINSEIEAINAGNEDGDLALLEAELTTLEEQKAALQNVVERVIKRQVQEVLSQQDIKVIFPPLNFQLEKPPYLLVISPRDRIETIRTITLLPSISQAEIEEIEAEVDQLGVSSLVVGVGGLATYPSLVSNSTGLQFTIDTVTEEWLHQYLAFRPLGFLYLLHLAGISRDYEIATINETLASMASKEIGSMVYEQYYSQYENSDSQNQAAESGFDFNREMRRIRRAVDEYLARGEVEQAEEFMEQKRQYLAAKGYHIRKLNQAYFAFYGTYADSPTSISPIGLELRDLRNQSVSLKDFLSTVAAMTSRQDLRESIR